MIDETAYWRQAYEVMAAIVDQKNRIIAEMKGQSMTKSDTLYQFYPEPKAQDTLQIFFDRNQALDMLTDLARFLRGGDDVLTMDIEGRMFVHHADDDS